MSQPSAHPPLVSPTRRVPRGDARRRELVAVADGVFLDHGFAETTMQMIASRAGASKETLYRHFVSKEELFAEAVRGRAARIAGADGDLPRHGAPRRVLFDLGCNLLRVMIRDERACALFRIVVAESPRVPGLGAIFYAQGPGSILESLTAYLRDATSDGHLRCRDPRRAARLFIGAVVANHHLLVLVAPKAAPIMDAEMRKHVRAAVAMFLARYRPPVRQSRQRSVP